MARLARPVVRDADLTSSPRGKDFSAGDPLRAFAGLAVVTAHVAATMLTVTGHPPADAAAAYAPYGAVPEVLLNSSAAAVWVFFALSAYLISRSWVRAFVAGRPSPSVSRYLRNRALRVFPVVWLGVGLVLALYGAGGASAGDVVSALTLTEDYADSPLGGHLAQLWSLHNEVVFYLLIPIIAVPATWMFGRRLEHRGRLMLVIAMTGVVAAAGLLYVHTQYRPGLGFFRSDAAFIVAFTPGVLLAAVELTGPIHPWLRKRARSLGAGVVGCGGAIVLATFAVLPNAPALVYALLTLGAGCLVGGLLFLEHATGSTWRLLDNRATHWLGARSYSFYVLHMLPLGLFTGLARSIGGYKVALLVVLPLVLLLDALLADVSFRLVERPFLRRKRRVEPTPSVPALRHQAPDAVAESVGARP